MTAVTVLAFSAMAALLIISPGPNRPFATTVDSGTTTSAGAR